MLLGRMNLISSLPPDTKDQSCSSGEPEMRSSPQRKSVIAHLEACPQPVTWPQSCLTHFLHFSSAEDVMSNRGNNLLLKLLQFRSVSFQCFSDGIRLLYLTLLDPLEVFLSVLQGQVSYVENEKYHEALGDTLAKDV